MNFLGPTLATDAARHGRWLWRNTTRKPFSASATFLRKRICACATFLLLVSAGSVALRENGRCKDVGITPCEA